MITHSLIVSVVESYAMAARQVRWLATILPDHWELIFVDDGSTPEIPIPEQRPKHFQLLRTAEVRQPGEWTQHLAINAGVRVARGEYFIKSDIDHVFSREAIEVADRYRHDMLLFNRRPAIFRDDFSVELLPGSVTSPADDIFLMRKSLFESLGGYPADWRHYGTGGYNFWEYSKREAAQRSSVVCGNPDHLPWRESFAGHQSFTKHQRCHR